MIDIYIDMKDLTNNQSLVFHDEYAKRWDVEEIVRSFLESSRRASSQSQFTKIVLERWRIQLEEPLQDIPVDDLGSILPRVYKNSIVLFRSLYAYAKIANAYKLAKRSLRPRSSHTVPKIRYRIYEGFRQMDESSIDELTLPLPESQRHVTEAYAFEPIDSPAGPFSITLTSRASCDFRIENSEAVLSSQFRDEDMFQPSLGSNAPLRDDRRPRPSSRSTEVGSLPHARRPVSDLLDASQAYGSLSTFHNVGPQVSSSPLSALRAAREINSLSPADSPPIKLPPDHRSVQGSRSSLKSTEGAQVAARRTSVSFMPFKSPSLSASPSQGDQYLAASPRGSVGRTSALTALAEARNPTLLPQIPSHARGSPNPLELLPGSSASSSPRPAARYSSSFGHRRARLSVGGSKTEDDNNSSGKASLTSSNAQPESGVLAEAGNTSSGSINTDDDNISDFLKMIDQKKDLKSFQSPSAGSMAEATTRRTTAALNKFQRLRESNAALTDSMASSHMLHRSSSSSSRQLSSVPPMVGGASTSISTSPGERMSPRTPHTPAIPSRLSANSIIAYNERERTAGRHRLSEGEDTRIQEQRETTSTQDQGTGAIDIPTSPRPFLPYRRSSSVSQQNRTLALDDDLGDILPFGMRSASMGDGEERQPLSLNQVPGSEETQSNARPANRRPSNPSDDQSSMSRQRSTSSHGGAEEDSRGTGRGIPYRPRIGKNSGRGSTPSHGSSTSLAGERGAGSGTLGGRYSFTRTNPNFEDDEPLLFAMSDFNTGQQGRKSLEDTVRRPNDTGLRESAARQNNRSGDSGWS